MSAKHAANWSEMLDGHETVTLLNSACARLVCPAGKQEFSLLSSPWCDPLSPSTCYPQAGLVVDYAYRPPPLGTQGGYVGPLLQVAYIVHASCNCMHSMPVHAHMRTALALPCCCMPREATLRGIPPCPCSWWHLTSQVAWSTTDRLHQFRVPRTFAHALSKNHIEPWLPTYTQQTPTHNKPNPSTGTCTL